MTHIGPDAIVIVILPSSIFGILDVRIDVTSATACKGKTEEFFPPRNTDPVTHGTEHSKEKASTQGMVEDAK
jgi:hypothetical protein